MKLKLLPGGVPEIPDARLSHISQNRRYRCPAVTPFGERVEVIVTANTGWIYGITARGDKLSPSNFALILRDAENSIYLRECKKGFVCVDAEKQGSQWDALDSLYTANPFYGRVCQGWNSDGTPNPSTAAE